MDNNEKMLPSLLPKSTELTRTNQSSTELCKMPYSGEIVVAKSNITRAKSNVTKAKPNVSRFNNGGGGGGGDNANGGPGGGNDGTTVEIFSSNSSYHQESNYSSTQSHVQWQYSSSESFCFQNSNSNGYKSTSSQAYSHEPKSTERNDHESQSNVISNHGSHSDDRETYLRKSPEAHQENDTREKDVNMSSIGIVLLGIVGLQLLLGLATAVSNLIIQICSSPLIVIILLLAGLFVLNKQGRSVLNKDGAGSKHLKAIQTWALIQAPSKLKALALNAQDKSVSLLANSKEDRK